MKQIPLNNEPPYKTGEILTIVASQATQGTNVADMRRRCRLLDAVEKAGDAPSMLLEDADHAFLVQLVNAFQFATANPKLLAVLDDIIEAKTPTANPAE